VERANGLDDLVRLVEHEAGTGDVVCWDEYRVVALLLAGPPAAPELPPRSSGHIGHNGQN
jgi:hypothetical protein